MFNFLIGINIGVFFAILVLSDFKMEEFGNLAKKFITKLENQGNQP